MHSYRRPRRIQYALGLYFVAFGGLVRAQGTPNPDFPQCNSDLTPPPCPLLESVMSACAQADGQIYVLTNVISQSLGVYSAPPSNNTALEKCQCTDVAYNLYAACAICQVGDDSTHWLNRENWFHGCIANSDETQIAVAPAGMVPENISLWMTQIYIPTFSLSEALEVQTSNTPLPTTPATQATETISGTPSNTVNGSVAPSNQNNSGSTTNTTPIIVGAVVGAFALLAIITLGILFCIRRRQKRERRSRRGPIIL